MYLVDMIAKELGQAVVADAEVARRRDKEETAARVLDRG